MKISIALCTYNGASFIQEQLESILNQKILPDELIICDDGSKDATPQIVEAFSKRAPFPVRFYQNEINLNINKNFEKALGLCSGDLIFLCDQDDVWLPVKIEFVTNWMEEHPGIEAVFTDAILTDQYLNPLAESLWKRIHFKPFSSHYWQDGSAFNMLVDKNFVTGATMCIRRSLYKKAIPFPETDLYLLHDRWLAFIATRDQTLNFLDYMPMYYRQHAQQTAGTAPSDKIPRSLSQKIKQNPSERLKYIQNQSKIFGILFAASHGHDTVPKNSIRRLKQSMEHFEIRSCFLQQPLYKRWKGVVREIFNRGYALNNQQPLLAILGDLFHH